MAQILEIIEGVLANKKIRSVLHTFFGISADVFYPQSRATETNIRKKTSKAERSYLLDGEPDETITIILIPLYNWTSTNQAVKIPQPEDDYEGYPQDVSRNFKCKSLLRFQFPKINRGRHFYYLVDDLEKIEGVKHLIISKLVLIPYNF